MRQEQEGRVAASELAATATDVALAASPVPVGSGAIVVPAHAELALLLSQAKAAGTLKDLRQTIAAWQAVAEKCDLVFEEFVRLAVFRLQVERELGAHLSQTVQRGGDRSKCPRATLLPEGVSKKQSSTYQKLAAIPEDVFRAYVEKSREVRKVPSSAGARRFASPTKTRAPARSRNRDGTVSGVPDVVVDACVRCLGEIAVLVGKAEVKAAACVKGLSDLSKVARGAILVATSTDPAESLRCIARLREKGRIGEAIVVLPQHINASWLTSLNCGPWSLCLPFEGGTPLVAHIGGHARGFALVFARLGVVVDVQHHVGAAAHA